MFFPGLNSIPKKFLKFCSCSIRYLFLGSYSNYSYVDFFFLPSRILSMLVIFNKRKYSLCFYRLSEGTVYRRNRELHQRYTDWAEYRRSEENVAQIDILSDRKFRNWERRRIYIYNIVPRDQAAKHQTYWCLLFYVNLNYLLKPNRNNYFLYKKYTNLTIQLAYKINTYFL